MNRRVFLKTLGIAIAGVLLGPRWDQAEDNGGYVVPEKFKDLLLTSRKKMVGKLVHIKFTESETGWEWNSRDGFVDDRTPYVSNLIGKSITVVGTYAD